MLNSNHHQNIASPRRGYKYIIMIKELIIVFFVAFLGLTSCNDYNEVKNEDLAHAFILNSSPTFKGYFYEGSDSTYHYFISKWDFHPDRYFKIAVKKLKIINSFKFEGGFKELRIDLLNDDNEEFAENEFYKLYIVRVK